jgi:hypothetical protein
MKSSFNSARKTEAKVKNRSTRTNGNSATGSQPTHEQIATLARQLYIQSGRQEGRDAENWLRAEQLLRQQAAAAPAASSPPQPNGKRENGSKHLSSRQ